MEKQIIKITVVLAALAVLMAGCAVGPDFQKPAPPAVKGYIAEPLTARPVPADATTQVQQFLSGRDIPAQWWELFHSPALNQLVERALKANPNLQAAQATLRQAQENVYAAEGTLYPAVNANGSVVREKTNGAQNGQRAPGSVFTLYNASVSVSYGIDLFGAARRGLESVEAQQEFQRFQLEGAYLTLTSNVVTTVVQEASLRAQIAAIRKNILAVSNLVLSLSTQPESFGRTTLEALRLGIPTAGYDHGGVGEILHTVYPAGLLQCDQIDASVKRIAELLQHPPPVPAGNFYPLQAMLDQTLAVYEELMRTPRN